MGNRRDGKEAVGVIEEAFRELAERFETSACFRWFGFRFAEFREGSAVLELELREELLNLSRVLHGGVSAAMLDTVMGLAVRSVTRQIPLTINLDVRYFRPVFEGTVRAAGKVVHHGNSIATAEAELLQGGVLMAKATGTFSLAKARAQQEQGQGEPHG